MTEAEWQKCADPNPLLKRLPEAGASARKLRLLVCACCRAAWPLFQGTANAQAVEVAERQADGLVSRKELRTIRQGPLEFFHYQMGWREEDLDLSLDSFEGFGINDKPAWCRRMITTIAATRAVQDNLRVSDVRQVLIYLGDTAPELLKDKSRTQARTQQCELIRDIFGPFRKVRIEPSVLAWNEGTIRKIAQVIYDERRFNDMPILADALEEAGCTDPDTLAHCRQPGEHARGCWLVDLLLQKS